MARKSRIQGNETEDKSRPRKTVFCNFVKVQSLTARFILHLIKEQAQIVVRKVSYCRLREIVRTERSDLAACLLCVTQRVPVLGHVDKLRENCQTAAAIFNTKL